MKRFIRSFDALCDAAFAMLAGCMKVSCAMLLCAFLFLLHMGDLSPDTVRFLRMARELVSGGAVVLLMGVLGCAVLQDLGGR